MEEQTLATEILHALKTSNRRWFIAFIVVLCLWFLTIGVCLSYTELPFGTISIEQKCSDDECIQTIKCGDCSDCCNHAGD